MVVGVPAITNVDEGIVLSISTLENWRSVPLRTKLSKIVDCLVIIENDTNLAAQGERYCGAAQAEETFILIHIGPNVGAGIVLGGQIYHGSQWSAGEIGYLRLPNTSRRRPTLHEFGELETVLTSAGILDSWHEAKKKPQDATDEGEKMDALGVLNLAQAGDARAEKIVQHRAGIVADIIVNLSLILNPGLILLEGEVGSHPTLINAVQKQLQESEFAVTKIGPGKLGNTSVLWGAIAIALEMIPSVLLPSPYSPSELIAALVIMTITLRIVPAVLLCLAFAPLSFARVPPKKAIVAYVFVKDAVLGPNDVAAGSLTRVNYAFANIENGKIVEGFAHDRENFQVLHNLKQVNPTASNRGVCWWVDVVRSFL